LMTLLLLMMMMVMVMVVVMVMATHSALNNFLLLPPSGNSLDKIYCIDL
jgi:hypothetical protein